MILQSRQPASAIKIAALLFVGVLGALGVRFWHSGELRSQAAVFEPKIQSIQTEPLCPWREPWADLKVLFPQATRYERETHILSGLRTELSKLLGRVPTADENALMVNRVYEGNTPVGAVLTRRVKGYYGAIELVLGVGTDGRVRGLRLQRHREPGTTAQALQEPNWLASFVGKEAQSHWAPGGALASMPAQTRASAEAIIAGTRSMLILLAAAERQADVTPHGRH